MSDEIGPRYLKLSAKKAEHGLTSAEAYEMQGLAEALDRKIEADMKSAERRWLDKPRRRV